MLNRKVKIFRNLTLPIVTFALIILVSCSQTVKIETSVPNRISNDASLSEQVNYTLDLAKYKIVRIIDHLENNNQQQYPYPTVTENSLLRDSNKDHSKDGVYNTGGARFWAAGNFTGLLWKMYELESDEKPKKFWRRKAILWSRPLIEMTKNNVGDMAINNLFVFKPWYENSSGLEKNRQLRTIFKGAKLLAEPLNIQTQKGRFAEDVGIIGYFRKASRTDNITHWHGFVDHTINVEQLLWAAEHNSNLEEADYWKKVATSHIKTLAKTMAENRNPGESGTWQRGYFDLNKANLFTYGHFLFNEGKQGWKDDSTWSRGQAWWVYATSVAYQYTQDVEILAIAKDAINYYLEHLPDRFPGDLRRQGDFIPPWDFDYALQINPDTERDSSASAIALSGTLRLINSLPTDDPDRQRYWTDCTKILKQLMSSQYLATPEGEMSILLHGCYHHYESISPSNQYDNGLIWGDYFFIDALQIYQNLNIDNYPT